MKTSYDPILYLWTNKMFFLLTEEAANAQKACDLLKVSQLARILTESYSILTEWQFIGDPGSSRKSQWQLKWVNHMIMGCFHFITHHEF